MTHGTGCTLSSAIASFLAKGADLHGGTKLKRTSPARFVRSSISERERAAQPYMEFIKYKGRMMIMREYATQMEAARKGIVTEKLKTVAGKGTDDGGGAAAARCVRKSGDLRQ